MDATTTGQTPGTATEEPPEQVSSGLSFRNRVALDWQNEAHQTRCHNCRDWADGFDAELGAPSCSTCAGGSA